jgi:central kinetochore subunit Mis15/CHL4
MARISVPTAARLPSSLRISASSPLVQKVLTRLSRPALLSLALDWLDQKNEQLSTPHLRDDENEVDDDADDLYPAARSANELREDYTELQQRKGSKREIVDRIVEGDWRHGLSMYQLAMADLQYLFEHPSSQKWSAYRIHSVKPASDDPDHEKPLQIDTESMRVPRFHPSTFLRNLQAEVLPDVKAHYNFEKHKELPLLILRIFILESPYVTDLATVAASGDQQVLDSDSSRTIYIAFPNASPYIYISKSQSVGTQPAAAGSETKSLRSLVLAGIPKALSRPRERYSLQATRLSTRNLHELVHRRGPGRTNNAGGGWSIYADEKKRESPLDTVLPTPPLSEKSEEASEDVEQPVSQKRALSPDSKREERNAKKRCVQAQARFGNSAKPDDQLGVERMDIVISDPLAIPRSSRRTAPDEEAHEEVARNAARRKSRGRRSDVTEILEQATEAAEAEDDAGADESWRPMVRLTFHGSHVFAGIRQLVEHGIIDGEKMPGWMTGEEGVTIGAVRHGRIRGIRAAD